MPLLHSNVTHREIVSTLRAEVLPRPVTPMAWGVIGTDWVVRFWSPLSLTHVQVHVQTTASAGTLPYDPVTFLSSTEIDVRDKRMHEVTVSGLDLAESYIMYFIPVQYDGSFVKILYDGLGGRPDDMTFISAP